MIVWKEVDWIQFAWNGKKNCISSRMAGSFLFADVAFVIHWQVRPCYLPSRQAHSLSNGVAVAGSATLHLANSEPSAHGVWQHLARGAVAFPFVEEPEAHRLRQVKHPVDGLKGFRVARYLLFLLSRYYGFLFHIAEFIQKHNCFLSFTIA